MGMALARALHHSAQRVEAPREGVEHERNDGLRKERSWRSLRRLAAPPGSPAIDMASLWSRQRNRHAQRQGCLECSCSGGGGGWRRGGEGRGADGVYDEQVSPCKLTDASNYGVHVPVDMTTLGPAPVCTAPKTTPQLSGMTAGTRRSVRRDVDHLVSGIARRHDRDVDDRVESCNINTSTQGEHCLDHDPCQCARTTVLLVHTLHDAEILGLPKTKGNTA